MKHFALALTLALLAAPAFAADLGEVVSQQPETPAANEVTATPGTAQADAEEVALPETLDFDALDTENKIISWNPCYNFDNKPQGCYRTWSPQTFCCIGRGYGCYDICY